METLLWHADTIIFYPYNLTMGAKPSDFLLPAPFQQVIQCWLKAHLMHKKCALSVH